MNNYIANLSDFRTRSEAMRIITESEDKSLVPQLTAILANKQLGTNIRWAAMQVLSCWQETDAKPILLNMMENNSELGTEARRALVKITGEDYGLDIDVWKKELLGILPEIKKSDYLLLLEKAMQGCFDSLVEDPDAGNFTINILLSTGRHQQIIIDFERKNDKGIPSAMLYSESGAATEASKEIFKEAVFTSKFGKPYIKVIEGKSCYGKKYFLPLEKLDEALLKTTVLGFAKEADDLEEKVTGEDII